MEQLEKFVVEFFRNLKCDVFKDGDVLIVEDVPRGFEDLYGKVSPYRLSFNSSTNDIFAGRGSSLLVAINKFLEGSGKTTLLKIDFDCDAEKEISNAISLKNCEISNLLKKHRNNFFSRFTFVTTFRYLNESEQVVNEIYVHDGKVVEGDLSGYTVLEGEKHLASGKHVEKDYGVARDYLKGVLVDKKNNISEVLGKRADEEIERIKEHYENLLGELGGDLTDKLEKIKEVELELRVADDDKKDALRSRLDRLRKGLVKVGDDEARTRILKEQDFTIKDAMHKYSLNIDNKLVNTTVIYYPVFCFNLFLALDGHDSGEPKGLSPGRLIDMTYDPLKKSLNKLNCEGCGVFIDSLNLCGSGHICCDNCLKKCGECGGQFCAKCLTRRCNVCGKSLCKGCSKMCLGCGKNTCVDHMRVDCVTGEERCLGCLRACLRCHGLSNPKYFGEAIDGSKVCQKCLGIERRGKVMDEIFKDN